MWMRILLTLALAGALFTLVLRGRNVHAATPFRLEQVAEGFTSPVGLTHAGDGSGRIFVVEQPGRVALLQDGKRGAVFLDIADRVTSGGEMGLLSIAFHPKFRQNGRCTLHYTVEEKGQLYSIVSEMTTAPGGGRLDPKSERQLLKLSQPYQNHNGGQNAFGPDGYLYIGFGDGGAGGDPHGNGQKLDTLLGKILRIDVDGARPYAIPADNPFVGRKNALPEIWAYGMRNPWRFGFDRATGDCWCADVGQNAFEEIDRIERGKNYGWNRMEGTHCFQPPQGCDTAGLTLPVKEYGRDQGVCTTGGYVYRGKARPELEGAYIYGDYGSGRIWSLRMTGGKVTEDRLLCESGRPITSFGEDESGELYVVTHEGRIWRLAPAAGMH